MISQGSFLDCVNMILNYGNSRFHGDHINKFQCSTRKKYTVDDLVRYIISDRFKVTIQRQYSQSINNRKFLLFLSSCY